MKKALGQQNRILKTKAIQTTIIQTMRTIFVNPEWKSMTAQHKVAQTKGVLRDNIPRPPFHCARSQDWSSKQTQTTLQEEKKKQIDDGEENTDGDDSEGKSRPSVNFAAVGSGIMVFLFIFAGLACLW